MIRTMKAAAAALVAVALTAGLALAQVPSIPPPPYNVPLNAGNAIPAPAASAANTVITNTLQTVGTVTKFFQGLAYGGIACTFNQTAASGSPTTTIEVDAFDAASQTYQQLVVSGAITASATPTTVEIYPDVSQTHAVTGMVTQGLHLPRFFRAKEVVADQGSTGAATTGTVGCDLLK